MRHVIARLVCLLTVLAIGPPAWSGGEPPPAPTNWLKVAPDPGGDIVQFVQRLPHDPNLLGVLAAHVRPMGGLKVR